MDLSEAEALLTSEHVTREQFLEILEHHGSGLARDGEPLECLVIRHPALPSELLLEYMRVASINAWSNPSSPVAALLAPGPKLEQALIVAALRAVQAPSEPMYPHRNPGHLRRAWPQVEASTHPMIVLWREQLRGLVGG